MDLLEKEWFIEAPWGRICIVAWGDCSDPPVLVCHGENDSAASWRPLLRLLPKNFYYIGMELPGNGKSDHLPPGLAISLFDLVYTLEVVRRHFRWDQFVYLAHSIAGTIGRLYNLAYPSRMSKVIELDQITPSFGITPDEFGKWYDYFFTRFYNNYDKFNAAKETAPAYTWEEVLEKLENRRGLSEEKARAVVERFSKPLGDGRIRFTIDQRMKLITRPAFSKEQLEELLTGMRTPTLAVIASNSVKMGYFMNTPYMLEEAAFDGTYRVRKVQGFHDVHITNPERVAPYVSQFLLYGLDGLDGKAKL